MTHPSVVEFWTCLFFASLCGWLGVVAWADGQWPITALLLLGAAACVARGILAIRDYWREKRRTRAW